jgi:chromosomal replication initiation ATPase DnaA
MTRATFDTLLRDSRLVDRAEDTLVVAASSAQAKAWLETKLLPVVTRTLTRLCGRAIDVQFVVPENVDTSEGGQP